MQKNDGWQKLTFPAIIKLLNSQNTWEKIEITHLS